MLEKDLKTPIRGAGTAASAEDATGGAAPPHESQFGSPLLLSKVHWVKSELVAEVTYLTWTEDNLLRQVSYQGSERTSRRERSCGLFPIRLDTGRRGGGEDWCVRQLVPRLLTSAIVRADRRSRARGLRGS